jgi:predicted Rdx family selenoprotein
MQFFDVVVVVVVVVVVRLGIIYCCQYADLLSSVWMGEGMVDTEGGEERKEE